MVSFTKRAVALVMVMAMIIPVLAACGGGAAQPQVIRETVVVVQTGEPVRDTDVEMT